ncbi:MAG: hypothetical protein US85_C0015G0009 [Candidatus Shapirobacteria bacterium GW2011_GWF1_38_23]|nr:MAG: hypothetical protein US85_C0015G0009 [Candidatus Shapirobacteria bacterium GW2011_GWF1_38_23]
MVLGIDPGLENTGWGVVENNKLKNIKWMRWQWKVYFLPKMSEVR